MTTASITSRAMLVTLSVSSWTARRFDRDASDDVTARNHAEHGAARVNKLLVPKETLAPVTSAGDAARAEHYRRTLPWADDGARILAASGYFAYRDAMADHKAAFARTVDTFLDQYASHRAAAPRQLGDLYRAADYPESWTLADKFAINWHVSPLPSGADFRVDLGDDVQTKLAAEIEERTRATVASATSDAWDRVRKVVGHLGERLDQMKATGEGERAPRLYESTLANILQVADLLPALNVNGDPEMDRIGREIRARFAGYDVTVLRTSTTAREKAAADVAAILAAMAPPAPMSFAAE